MAGAPCQGVEQRRAIPAVARRQDVGRIGGPEEDPLAPQMRRPCVVDPSAVRQQPAANQRFGQARTLVARRRRGEVAQPREALELLRQWPGCTNLAEIDILEDKGFAADGKPACEERIAARALAANMVTRDGDDLERLPGRPQARKKRAAGEPADNSALFSRAAIAHELPLSALILSA